MIPNWNLRSPYLISFGFYPFPKVKVIHESGGMKTTPCRGKFTAHKDIHDSQTWETLWPLSAVSKTWGCCISRAAPTPVGRKVRATCGIGFLRMAPSSFEYIARQS